MTEQELEASRARMRAIVEKWENCPVHTWKHDPGPISGYGYVCTGCGLRALCEHEALKLSYFHQIGIPSINWTDPEPQFECDCKKTYEELYRNHKQKQWSQGCGAIEWIPKGEKFRW